MFARAGVTVMGKHRYVASSNGIGGVGHADEVGVFDFDSASLDSSSSCHSNDGVSHISTVRGSLKIKSGYERAVHNFRGLENQWLNEADSLQQQTLYKSIFEAEIVFEVQFVLCSFHDRQSRKELSVPKDKTRQKMRTRLKNNVALVCQCQKYMVRLLVCIYKYIYVQRSVYNMGKMKPKMNHEDLFVDFIYNCHKMAVKTFYSSSTFDRLSVFTKPAGLMWIAWASSD